MPTAQSNGTDWFFTVFAIGFYAFLALMCIHSTKNWKERRRNFITNPLCFRLVTDKRHIRNAVALTSVLCCLTTAAAIWIIVILRGLHASHDGQMDGTVMIPLFLGIWLMFMMTFVGSCIEYLTSHLCLSDLNIRVQSVFNNPQEKALNWKQITSVEIHHHASDPSKLNKVVIKGDLRSMPIVISGKHPQIGAIILLIKDTVPDKLTDISDTQSNASSRIFKVISGAVYLVALIWSLYLLTLIVKTPQISSASRLYTTTIWAFGMWECAANLIIFAANFQQRQQEFAKSTACYPILGRKQSVINWVVFITMMTIVSAACLFILDHRASYIPIVSHTAAVVFMLSVILGTLKLVQKLTARICIDDEEVCIKSLVANGIETHIGWNILSGIDVIYDATIPSKISRLLLSTAPPSISEVKRISITSDNECIDQIAAELQHHAPEKFGVAADGLSPIMPGAQTPSHTLGRTTIYAILGCVFFALFVLQRNEYAENAVWVLFLLPMVLYVGVSLSLDFRQAYDSCRYWQVRMSRISAAPYRYKLNQAVVNMQSLGIFTVIYELVLLSVVVIFMRAQPHQSVWIFWMVMAAAIYIVLALRVPLYWLYYFTAHYCIDKRGIICTSASSSFYDKAVRWDELTKLIIVKSNRSPSGISSIRLVTTTPQSSMTISGKHPDIITIMQHIRDNAPDVFEAKTDDTPVR